MTTLDERVGSSWTVEPADQRRQVRRPERNPTTIYMQVRQPTTQGPIWRTVAYARSTGAEWQVRVLYGRLAGQRTAAITRASAEQQLDALTAAWQGGLA